MSTDPGSGGYHWKDEENVERWVEARRSESPERVAGFAAMVEHLPSDRSRALRVLDLGAGDGNVASVVLENFPNATAILVDFSEAMMTQGRESLQRFAGRFDYFAWDMNEGDWPEELAGPYDAVVSAAALHHLQSERKEWLSREVFARLSKDGVFANFDLFNNEGAVFTEDQVHAKTCATMASAISFLERAGFANVIVAARAPRERHQAELALMAGRKQ